MAQTKINIEVNGHKLTATLNSNSSAEALAGHLESGPVSVVANEYGGFEMVGELPWSLPRNDRQIKTAPGNIILYLGSNICFYYSVNSWNFTPLGSFDNASSLDLKSIFGTASGTARFTLSLAENSATDAVETSGASEIVAIHGLDGVRLPHNNPAILAKGMYIVTTRCSNGKTSTRKIKID